MVIGNSQSVIGTSYLRVFPPGLQTGSSSSATSCQSHGLSRACRARRRMERRLNCARLADFDPLEQRRTVHMRATLWRDDLTVRLPPVQQSFGPRVGPSQESLTE